MELRILFHAPDGRDSALVSSVVGASYQVSICEGAADLARCLNEGSAAAILTEEALAQQGLVQALSDWLAQQPCWSDFPFIVLAGPQQSSGSAGAIAGLDRLGNVILLEHPLNARTLASAADTVVRCRLRQYAIRQHLEEISQDRTEAQRRNGELQSALSHGQKKQMIGRLAGEIAHDFNNLLHVVNMNLELISLFAKEEKVKPVVERARTAARRGARLTGQLLAFTRNQPQSSKSTDVNRLLLGMQDLLEISVGSGIAIGLDLCEGQPAVVVDASQLEMAVLNLAVNAREAMPKGGAITISTCMRNLGEGETALKAGDYVAIGVSDTGEGIAPQMLSKVFDRFFTTRPPGSGSGLGLSQVHDLARQCGGLAFISSEPGKGTRVEMCFPAASPDAGAEHEAAAPAPELTVRK